MGVGGLNVVDVHVGILSDSHFLYLFNLQRLSGVHIHYLHQLCLHCRQGGDDRWSYFDSREGFGHNQLSHPDNLLTHLGGCGFNEHILVDDELFPSG